MSTINRNEEVCVYYVFISLSGGKVRVVNLGVEYIKKVEGRC